jgi:hypothetical protein
MATQKQENAAKRKARELREQAARYRYLRGLMYLSSIGYKIETPFPTLTPQALELKGRAALADIDYAIDRKRNWK